MNKLKFQLSVIFTKTGLSPSSNNNMIKEEYINIFGEEIQDEDLNETLGIIINEQIEQYNNYVQEIPEDYNI